MSCCKKGGCSLAGIMIGAFALFGALCTLMLLLKPKNKVLKKVQKAGEDCVEVCENFCEGVSQAMEEHNSKKQ